MDRIKIVKSKIQGKGIISAVELKKGDFVGFVKGPIKHKHNKGKKDSEANPDWVGFKKDYWIDPLPPFKYINHSCEPNCGIKGTKSVYAIKNIKIGDELTFDYSISEIDLEWELDYICKCGSKSCRKKICSIQSLSKKKIAEYLPYVPTHFIKYIKT